MRSRVGVRTRAVSICGCLALLGLAGCTSTTGGTSQVTVSGKTLTVYASQPPRGSGGQAATDMLDAEQLALQQAGGRAGQFTVKLVKLDGRELSDNARTAVENQSTIAYLGEIQPGTSQISVAILNQQGILEVSPSDTADYLTQATPAVPGSPTTFYPARTTYHATFARVAPNTAQEAKALVAQMQADKISKLYVAHDQQGYSAAIALEVEQAARQAGVSTVTGAGDTASVRASGADALFYGSTDDSPGGRSKAVALLNGTAAALPTVKLFAPSGLYDADLAGALSPAAQSLLTVSSPGFLPAGLPSAGQQFVSRFQSAFGHAPATQAIFGYESMAALLSVISSAGKSGNNRALVVAGFRALHSRQSAIGTYSISGGDPSIAPFVMAHVRGGQLVPFTAVSPQG